MRNWRDWQSALYLVALPLVVLWQWLKGFGWPLYVVELFLTLGVGVIHHNHTHLRIWRSRRLNRLTDVWITVLQGHPTYVFYPAHISNHHRHKHGSKDITRTYRFNFPGARGDTNHLFGYFLHPFQAITVLYPQFIQWLKKQYHWRRKYFYYCMLQYVLVIGLWLILAIIDWKKCLVLIIILQLFGLHSLLATNYLQHAHADGRATNLNYARNFHGWVNPLLFNIGLHTAHHQHPRMHWSSLPPLDNEYSRQVNPILNQQGLVRYMLRTYFLGFFSSRWRSRSLHKKE